jgi:hypothetical protein
MEHLALSSNNLRMMKDWIQDCRYNHFACCPLANTTIPARPTRLVYVGDRRSDNTPRLVINRDLPEEVRYAALSYCWGRESCMRLTTTKETFSSRRKAIPWDESPRTLCDKQQECSALIIFGSMHCVLSKTIFKIGRLRLSKWGMFIVELRSRLWQLPRGQQMKGFSDVFHGVTASEFRTSLHFTQLSMANTT